MTIDELISALEEAKVTLHGNGDVEVRLVHQPSWPLQYRAGETALFRPRGREPIFYIGEGSQSDLESPYVPGRVMQLLGWREMKDEDSEDDEG